MRTLGKEVVTHNQDVEDEYSEMHARRRELGDQLSEVTGEMNQILAALGAQVAEGKGYQKQTARLSELRSQSEALQAGVLYVDGQRALLERLNTWLRSR